MDRTTSEQPGLKILLLDGGEPGTTEFSQIVILEEILYRLTDETNEEDPYLADIFDIIGGSGFGAVIAILAVSLRLSISEISQFYLRFHERLLSQPIWRDSSKRDPERNAAQVKQLFKDLLRHHDLDKPLIQEMHGENQCRAFLCAINTQAPEYAKLFTTYSPKSRSTTCNIIDALQIAFTDGVHLSAVTFQRPGEHFIGTVHHFSDLLSPMIQEVQSVFEYTRPIAMIVSVGVGYPKDFATERSREICEACTRHADSWVRLCAKTKGLFFRFCVTQPPERENPHALEILKTDTVQYLYDSDLVKRVDLVAEKIKKPIPAINFLDFVILAEKDYGNPKLVDYQLDGYVEKVQKWLSPVLLIFRSLENIRERREPGTGQWFVDSEPFVNWMHNKVPLFVLQGIAGAGKTFFAQFIHETLTFKREEEPDIFVLGYFIKYDTTTSLKDILSSLLAQTFLAVDDIPQEIRNLYEQKQDPTEIQLKETIAAQLRGHATVFIVIDALDEFPSDDHGRKTVVEELLSLSPKVRVFVTSRPDLPLTLFSSIPFNHYVLAGAKQQDIHEYVRGFLNRQPRLRIMLNRDPGLYDKIAKAVIEECHDMFLLLRFHIDQVGKCRTVLEVEDQLQHLPTDPKVIYREGVKRLRCQDERDARRALHAVMWVVYARRQLHIEELLMAVGSSTEDISGHPVENAMVNEEILLSLVGDLIFIFDRQVSLINRIAHDTLLEDEQEAFNDGSWTIATGCLRYLTSIRSRIPILDKQAKNGDSYAKLLAEKKRAWFTYCAQSWGYHATKAKKEVCEAYRFFENTACYEESLSHLLIEDWAPHREGFTPLHMCSYFGIDQLVKSLLQRENTNINGRNVMGATALHCAAKAGNISTIELLLAQDGVDPDPRDCDGRTPLDYAREAGRCDVVKLMEERMVL